MHELRAFRSGIYVFAFAAICSLVAVVVVSSIGSVADFSTAAKSWNCRVSQGAPSFFGPTFCLPQPLQIAIMALFVSCAGLGALTLNRALAVREHPNEKRAVGVVRFGLAALVVGTNIDLQMFVAGYALDYRGPLVLVVMFFSAMVIAAAMFPRTRLVVLPLLSVPLSIVGFFVGVLLAAMFGIPFD